MDDHVFRRSELINTPMRTTRGQPIISREFNLFKQLSGSTLHIDIHDLYTAYQEVMNSHDLKIHDIGQCFELLLQVRLPSGDLLVDPSNHVISYARFSTSFSWVLMYQKGFSPFLEEMILSKTFRFDWHRYGVFLLTGVFDILIALTVTVSDLNLPFWLMVARSSAIIILVNMTYVLAPMIKVSNLVPDYLLGQLFPSEFSSSFHKIFGVKILIASLLHVIGHVIHLHVSIERCKSGCTRESIRVVPISKKQITISFTYFTLQYAYITGFVLSIAFISLAVIALASHYGALRYGTNQLLHKLIAVICIIVTIAHGCSQLLGFNFSLILTLPLLIIYVWQHRREVKKYKIKIVRWVVTPTLVRLYLNDNRCMSILDKFDTAVVYINHSDISRFEWHPFTLSRSSDTRDAVIAIKRVGEWTNKLGNLLSSRVDFSQNINIGNVTRSKFRFHNQYNVRYFLCAGIGITAFISVMRDTIKSNVQNYSSVLIWSISNIDIVKEFSGELKHIVATVPGVHVRIFFSNSRNPSKTTSESSKSKFTYLQSMIFKSSGYDIATNCHSVCCCSFTRVDFMSVLTEAILKNQYSSRTIGVFVCGPRGYVTHAHKCVEMLNHNNHNITLRIWSEGV